MFEETSLSQTAEPLSHFINITVHLHSLHCLLGITWPKHRLAMFSFSIVLVFSVKGQIVNILGFVGGTVSVATIHPC